jgi:glycosyltransferase involved in cell wall biosynthesis
VHIGFLTPEYPHPNTGSSGGIGTSIKGLAAGLAALGQRVTVFVYGQPVDAAFTDGSVQVVQIKNPRLKGLSWWLLRQKLTSIINASGVDVLEAPDWTGITALMSLHCPIVIRMNGSDTYFCRLENRPLKYHNFWLERNALRRADGLISVSRFTAERSCEYFDLGQRLIEIIPNGIETIKFPLMGLQEADPNLVLYVGTLIRKKGLLELPHIFNKIVSARPDTKLLLIGGDAADIQTGSPSTWALMQPLFSTEAAGRVSYMGKVPYAEVQSYLAKAAVCVFPSFAEALPVSWIEAMAMGKPVVASSIGWATEVIEDGVSGLLAHPTDHHGFADKILRTLQESDLAQALCESAYQRASQYFEASTVARQSLEFYRKIING